MIDPNDPRLTEIERHLLAGIAARLGVAPGAAPESSAPVAPLPARPSRGLGPRRVHRSRYIEGGAW